MERQRRWCRTPQPISSCLIWRPKPARPRASGKDWKTLPMTGSARRVRCSTRCAPNMTYCVELTARATRTLKRIFRYINAESSPPAFAWFNELEAAILSLDQHPETRVATVRLRGDENVVGPDGRSRVLQSCADISRLMRHSLAAFRPRPLACRQGQST